MIVTWQRFGGYEVSSRGDRRFSPLFATMPDGRTIEMHYQCDVKGWDPGGFGWRMGKGRPSRINGVDLQSTYHALWVSWATLHQDLVAELLELAELHNYILSDVFARSPINQAHSLSLILNERFYK